MSSLQSFLHMGGYAFYVWSAYGLSFIVLVLNVVLPLKREQQFFRALIKRKERMGKNK